MLGGEFDLDLEVLLPRFRQLFPNKSRKSLTEEFTKLAQFTHYDNKKQGVRTPLTALEFKASLTKAKPSFQGLFTEEEFHLIFAFFDTEENKKIALFEFVKGIRGNLSPYRQALTDFIFKKLDKDDDNEIDEKELYSFIRDSTYPDILSGLVKPRVKCSAILKSFGANKQVISRVQFTDYYLTKSLSTEQDNKFKKDLLAEWLISDYEIDNYMTKYHQGLKPSKHKNKLMSQDFSQASLATTSSQFSLTAQELPASKRKSSGIVRKDSETSSSSSLVSLVQHESVLHKSLAFLDAAIQLRELMIVSRVPQILPDMLLDNKQEIETIVHKFRKLFPVPSRKALTAEFKKLSNIVFKEDSKQGVGRPLEFAEFKAGVLIIKPEIRRIFTEEELIRLFAYIDISSAQRITLFEFVKSMRGDFSPYRRAIVEFAYNSLNSKNDSHIDEEEIMEYYKNSENQSIKDGTSTVTLKSNAFFKLMGCQKSDKRVKIEQFMDFYLTESINTETDERFRNSILEEWEINESEIDNYISESFPGMIKRSKSDSITSSIDDNESLNSLISRFRKFFPTFSRKGLTVEFKKISNIVFKEDSVKGIGRPLGLSDFDKGLKLLKPGMMIKFTFKNIERLFKYMDVNLAQRITLFEFVKGMRGCLSPFRQAMVEFIFIYIDIKNDGYIDEDELVSFYQTSDLPDVLDGTHSPKSKANSFFVAVGCSNKTDRDQERQVRVEQFIDFYITQSLATDSDREFKSQILIEYNLSNKQMDEYIAYRYPNIKFKFESATSNTAISTSAQSPGPPKHKYKGIKDNLKLSDSKDSQDEALFLHNKGQSDRSKSSDFYEDQGRKRLSDTGRATSLRGIKSSDVSSPDSAHKVNQPAMSVPSSRRPLFSRQSAPDIDSPGVHRTDSVEETKGDTNTQFSESRKHRKVDAVERSAGAGRTGEPAEKNTTPVKKHFNNHRNSLHLRDLPASLGARAISELLVDFEEEWNDTANGEATVDMKRRKTDPNPRVVEKLQNMEKLKEENKVKHLRNNVENNTVDRGNDNLNYETVNDQNVNDSRNSRIDNSNGIRMTATRNISQMRTKKDDSLDTIPKNDDNDGSFADRIVQDLQNSSIESLRGLMGSIMVTTYEQKKEIEKLNRKIERLCGLLTDDMKG